MPFMAKQGNNYEEVETLVDTEGREIDYVLSKVGNTYKRTFTKVRELEDAPPLNFKSIKPQANLLDYRIYGQTVDGESVGDRTGNLLNFPHWANNVYVVRGTKIINGNSIAITSTAATCFTGWNTTEYPLDSKIPVAEGEHITFTWDTDANDASYVWIFPNATSDASVHTASANKKLEYTVPAGVSFITFRLDVSTANKTITYSNLMITKEDAPTTYEPYGYKVPVTVEGKNLLQNTATRQTINGVTFTVNEDKSVTCDTQGQPSSGTALFRFGSIKITKDEPLIISGCPHNGSLNSYRADLRYANTNTVIKDNNNNESVCYGSEVNATYNETVTVEYCIRIASGYTCDNLTFYPMIRKADITDDTYEPYYAPVTTPIYLPEQIKKVGDEAEYIDYGEQKQHRVRKNLLATIATSRTLKDVTFTVNEDDSVTCNGTASGNIDYRIVGLNSCSLPAGNYCLTGAPPTANYSSYYLRAWYDSSGSPVGVNDFGNGANFTLTDTMTLLCAIVIALQQVLDNVTFYPMIRKADIEDDTYEPYIESTDLDVTLPALPTVTGTNVLSVGTEVQPSDMYIKGNIKGGGAA